MLLLSRLHQVTRYQGWPGQATAYMVGRLGILGARENATSALGEKFSLKDFHYQVTYKRLISFEITLLCHKNG